MSIDPSVANPITASPNEASRRTWWHPLVLVGIVVAIYGWTVSFSFVDWDDTLLIPQNAHVRTHDLDSLQYIWTQGYIKIYMPITYSLWWIEALPARAVAKMAGYSDATPLAPGVYHFTTVLLFVGCVLQLYRLLTRLVGDRLAALLGTCLYAVHPIQAEAAAWVSENKGLLATLFGFSSLICYVDFARAQTSRGRTISYVSATLLFVCALLSKPSAVALPLVAALIDWGLLRRKIVDVATGLGAWVVLAGLMIYKTQLVQGDAITEPVDIAQRPFIVAHSLLFYLQKLFIPLGLAPSYDRGPNDVLALTSQPELIGAVTLAALGALLLSLWLVGRRTAAAVIAIFLVLLAPNLGFANFAYQAISTTADRYLAAAMFAPALGLAYVLASTKNPAARWATIGICVILGVLSLAQTVVWRTSDALIAYQLRQNPDSATFLHSRAAVRLRRGEFEGARDDAARALEIWPNLPGARVKLALAQGRLGEVDGAIETLRQAMEADPTDRDAIGLAIEALTYQRRYSEALELAKKLDTEFGAANLSERLRYGRLLILNGKEAEGIEIYASKNKGGKELSPLDAQLTIAFIFEHMGEYAKAVQRYRKINADYGGKVPNARLRLAWVLATAPDELVRQPEEALRIAQQLSRYGTEGLPRIMDVLAAAQASAGKYEDAAKTADEAAMAAEKENNSELAREIDQRLKLYKKDKPFLLPKRELFPAAPEAADK